MSLTADQATAHFTALRPRLIAFARLQLRDASLAEDAVQDAMLTAFEKHASFEGRSEFETWVFGILKFKILDQLRRQRRQGTWQPLNEEMNDDTLDRLFQR
ncbi:MAG: sigma-70 family RNA polymerase sigma factor, partial [Halomonas sp.]